MGSSKPSSPIHYTVRAERAVKRYTVGGEKFSERTRLALGGFASVFGREDDDTLYAGALANVLGDGNGWTAATTIRSFVARGWVESRWNHRLPSWMRAFRITDDGLRMLRELDRQFSRERCPDCKGATPVRNATSHFGAVPDGMCTTCGGTRLLLRSRGRR